MKELRTNKTKREACENLSFLYGAGEKKLNAEGGNRTPHAGLFRAALYH
jgi:hypothetical protein